MLFRSTQHSTNFMGRSVAPLMGKTGFDLVVLAYTDKSAGYKGMSAFIVESSWDGVSLGKKETNMGQRASDTRAVIFEDVHVPVENLIGGVEGAGWFNAMKAFDLSRPNVASRSGNFF